MAVLAACTSRFIFEAAHTSVYGMNGRNCSGRSWSSRISERSWAASYLAPMYGGLSLMNRRAIVFRTEVWSKCRVSDPKTLPPLTHGETTKHGTRRPVVGSISGETLTAGTGGTWS